MKKAPTAAERRYMAAVAALGCVICARVFGVWTACIVHHQRTGTGGMRASHYRTCGLCPPHHQFSGYGVHDMGRPEFEAKYGFSEVDMIEETRTKLVHLLPPVERQSKVLARGL